jgi:hypothetical protein
MVCDYDGRRPEFKKVQRILEWPIPESVKDARGFIGVVVYYRIFIESFSIIAAPIFILFRKGTKFVWSKEQQMAMNELQRRLSQAPILITLDFSPSALAIVLNVDASTTIGWGAVLSQHQNDGTTRPARYESGIWSDNERKYDAVKLECRGLMKALKKLRFWLYGRHFYLETDARTLVWILNQPPNDLPNAMMTRWLTYIRLFDFTVKHIPGRRNGAADALSRRGVAQGDSDEDSDAPDEYFESMLYSISFSSDPSPIARVYLLDGEYGGDDLLLGRYLEKLERPDGLSDEQFAQLRRKSRGFLVRDGYLFKRSRKRGVPPRRVLGTEERRREAIRTLHDESGHRGVQSTFTLVSRRYQWKGMYEDVVNFVKTCEECQKRARTRYEEPLHPTWSVLVWGKIGVDIVFMPDSTEGFKYIVFARDDLSGWVEGRAIKERDARSVAKFLYEDIICRHGCPARVVMDRGTENMGITAELLEAYQVKKVSTSSYHPQTNGLVERGHDPIVNALSKYCSRAPETWSKYLSLAMWSDRISVRRSTGYSAFEMVYGRDALLPLDLSLESWSVVDWEGEVQKDDRTSLILARMRQLDERTLREAKAAENLENSRRSNKAYFDEHWQHRMRSESQQLRTGDLVLLRNSRLDNNRARRYKLSDKWFGPYRIREIPENSTHYLLEELDGTELKDPAAGNRLKKFFSRTELDRIRAEQQSTIRVRDVRDLDDEEEDQGNLQRDEDEDVYG